MDTMSGRETIQREGRNPGSTWWVGKRRLSGVMCYTTVMSQDMVKLGLEPDFLLHHTLWPHTVFWVLEGCVCMCVHRDVCTGYLCRGMCRGMCAGVYAGVDRVCAGV